MPARGRAKTDRALTGRTAEALAARLLEEKGMRVVATNWRRPSGEIDIVAMDGGTCVFVEVRSRRGDGQVDPLETIDARKQQRVIRAARLYLAEEDVTMAAGFRFDVVGVTFLGPTTPPSVVHLENAFET